jgi:hypothetical protein
LGLPGLKNPTFKKGTLKNVTLKNPTQLRTTRPLRTISPTRHAKANDAGHSDGRAGAAPGSHYQNARRTDFVAGSAAAQTVAAVPMGSAAYALGERLPLSNSALLECHLLDVDLDALIDRYFEVEAKKAAKGKRIADPSRYLVKMAKDERAKKNGVLVETLEGISSPNEWTRGAAYARAMSTPDQPRRFPAVLPDERQRQRIAKDLERSGFVPVEIEARWAKARSEGTTRLDYLQYANALRANSAGIAQRRAMR